MGALAAAIDDLVLAVDAFLRADRSHDMLIATARSTYPRTPDGERAMLDEHERRHFARLDAKLAALSSAAAAVPILAAAGHSTEDARRLMFHASPRGNPDPIARLWPALKPRLQSLADADLAAARRAEAGGRGRRITADEADARMRSLQQAHPEYVHLTQRQWARLIPCAAGLVGDLPLWKENAKKTGRGKSSKVDQLARLVEDQKGHVAEGSRNTRSRRRS